MRWFSNRCGRYRQDICLLAGGALPARESGEVRSHLAECGHCRAYYNDIKRVSAPLANWDKNFTQVEPNRAMQMRWANAIKAAAKPPAPSSPQFWAGVLWRELVWPCRHAWTAMAAVWLVMVWINLGSPDHRPASMNARSAPAAEVWQALEEQRRLLAELVPSAPTQPAEPPRQNSPRPRSDLRQAWGFFAVLDLHTCPNPKGILAQSPGLRGTSYPGSASYEDSNPNEVVTIEAAGHNPIGVEDSSRWISQGSSFLATLGWRTQSLRDWANRLQVGSDKQIVEPVWAVS